MLIGEFDYNLPEEQIAQRPLSERDLSKLMVINRKTGIIDHKVFTDVLKDLHEGDCLVLNDSRVIPARLYGLKASTGAKIEFLLTKRIDIKTWQTMIRPGKRLKQGDRVHFGLENELTAEVLGHGEEGTRIVKFFYQGVFEEILDRLGHVPLPPYIRRESDKDDRERYQTVYSKNEGSVAAPTAGLHFTDRLLKDATNKGVRLAYVTLHVGIGTFRPVKSENILEHHMHFENYTIDEKNAKIINDTKSKGGRIIAVGTTSTRTLESACDEKGILRSTHMAATNLFIYPGYQFKIVDGIITNFHLPKSTLLMLVSAFYNREAILKAYNDAVALNYRFFSYGDAMFIY